MVTIMGNSTDLDDIERGKHGWQLFERGVGKELGRKRGAYVLRLGLSERAIGRLFGKSRILYIGQSSGKQGIASRIAQYFSCHKPTPSRTQTPQITNRRVHRALFSGDSLGTVQIRILETGDPVAREAGLLEAYVERHGEAPPLNANTPGVALRNFECPADCRAPKMVKVGPRRKH